ncbi:MAG: sulfatase [Verrucomicrobiales bacterium]|nr:sulfatase [Verrucomicrobiales bacterium]
MKATRFFPLFSLLLALAGLCPADERPNVLIILTDDQGWPTLGCYGSERVPTPHLDRLAASGMRLTDAYVMPQCTPTRASLLSGQHTARNGMWHVIPWYGLPWARIAEPPFREQFPRDTASLPRMLHQSGYRTGMAGKWHLTTGTDGDYVSLRPEAAGDYGFDFVAPRGPGTQNEGDKWVDHLTDSAIRFIRSADDRPWFFYLAHHTLHGIVSAPEDLVKKHRQSGAPDTGLFNATYLAAIEHLDTSVGRLLGALDETGQRGDTLVLFLSDNGGLDTVHSLPETSDGSTPLTVRTREFDNAPLREGKGGPYEGGIRVPCLVSWPASIPAGQVSGTPVHVTDWLPTLLSAARVPIPDGHPLDGVDLMPLLRGGTIRPRALHWYMPLYDLRWAATPCAVIRDGDWKLIEYFGDSFDDARQYRPGRKVELYHLADDLGESRDLSTVHPDRARDLQAALRRWMATIPVPVPSENPHFDPAKALLETREKQPWNP